MLYNKLPDLCHIGFSHIGTWTLNDMVTIIGKNTWDQSLELKSNCVNPFPLCEVKWPVMWCCEVCVSKSEQGSYLRGDVMLKTYLLRSPSLPFIHCAEIASAYCLQIQNVPSLLLQFMGKLLHNREHEFRGLSEPNLCKCQLCIVD